MLSTSLDRFAYPLESERVSPSLMSQMIQEQRERNKIEIVDNFILGYWYDHYEMPDVETIQEFFPDLDLDQDMIKERLELF